MSLAPTRSAEQGRASAPLGWADFCIRYRDACGRERVAAAEITFDGEARDLILAVNAQVNAAIAPRTDLAHWGLEERWDFAETGIGDCEDVVLLKQRWLVSAGLPRGALLVTVVTDLAGDGHAVLTVVTDRGDFILDNMHDEVKLWRETPYGFVKRQSRSWTDEWVAVNGQGVQPAVASR